MEWDKGESLTEGTDAILERQRYQGGPETATWWRLGAAGKWLRRRRRCWSKDGWAPAPNLTLLPQAALLALQVPLKGPRFQADGGFTDNKEDNTGGEKMIRPSFREAKHQGKSH